MMPISQSDISLNISNIDRNTLPWPLTLTRPRKYCKIRSLLSRSNWKIARKEKHFVEGMEHICQLRKITVTPVVIVVITASRIVLILVLNIRKRRKRAIS